MRLSIVIKTAVTLLAIVTAGSGVNLGTVLTKGMGVFVVKVGTSYDGIPALTKS